MRKIIAASLFLSFLMGTVLFAGSVKAYISHFVTSSSEYCYLYLSNITDEDVTVEVTLYEDDGSVLYDSGSGIFSGNNFSDYTESPPSGASVRFTIEPNESGQLSIHVTSGVIHGYGKIEYTGEHPGLIGSMVIIHTNLSTWRSERTIAINNGLPF